VGLIDRTSQELTRPSKGMKPTSVLHMPLPSGDRRRSELSARGGDRLRLVWSRSQRQLSKRVHSSKRRLSLSSQRGKNLVLPHCRRTICCGFLGWQNCRRPSFLDRPISVVQRQRTTVTVIAGNLQKKDLIRYSRGHVTIVDRESLIGAARECYRITRSNELPQLDVVTPQ
jgi:hypothetical protein